jgi:hypothetical protein
MHSLSFSGLRFAIYLCASSIFRLHINRRESIVGDDGYKRGEIRAGGAVPPVIFSFSSSFTVVQANNAFLLPPALAMLSLPYIAFAIQLQPFRLHTYGLSTP